MENPMSIIHCLQDLYPTLSPMEQTLATYFQEHEENLTSTPILQVAQECNTSKSAVVRLCKRLGFNGYKDFLTSLSAELALRQRNILNEYSDIYPDRSVGKICAIVTQNNIQALESTLRLIDIPALEKAVETICKTSRIDFYGMGNSGILAEDAELKFRRIGYTAYAATDKHRMLIGAATLKPGDVAVFFSYYGTTKDILEVHEVVRRQGATTIAITCTGKSPLHEKADIVLETASTESLTRSGAMTSRIAMLSVLDMMFTAVSSRNYKKIKGVLDHTAEIIRKEHSQ